MTRRSGATARTLFRKSHQHAGDLMKLLMEEAKLTPKELAERSGVDLTLVEDLLAKRKVISNSASMKLSTALGVGELRLYKVHQSWVEAGGDGQN